LFFPKRSFEDAPGRPAIYILGENTRFYLDTTNYPLPDYHRDFVEPVEDIIRDLFQALVDVTFCIEEGYSYSMYKALSSGEDPEFRQRVREHWSFIKEKVIQWTKCSGVGIL